MYIDFYSAFALWIEFTFVDAEFTFKRILFHQAHSQFEEYLTLIDLLESVYESGRTICSHRHGETGIQLLVITFKENHMDNFGKKLALSGVMLLGLPILGISSAYAAKAVDLRHQQLTVLQSLISGTEVREISRSVSPSNTLRSTNRLLSCFSTQVYPNPARATFG